MYIEANGKTYTFYDHAVRRMTQRGITLEVVEQALRHPDDIFDLTLDRRAYDKVGEAAGSIGVVVDEVECQIVTVYFMDGTED